MKKDTVVIDIDGCLNYYPDPLKMWAEVWLNLDQSESGQAIDKKNDFDLLKKTYRQSSLLSHLLPRSGVTRALQEIKKRGYTIVLLTARNPKKNPLIKKITEDWLKRHKIAFDTVIFVKDKKAYFRKNENRIIMLVEDDPNYLNSFKKLKTEVVAFKNELNRNFHHPHFHTVSSWKGIGDLFASLTSK